MHIQLPFSPPLHYTVIGRTMLKCGRLLRQAEAEVVRITNRGHAAVFCFPLIVALRSIHSFIPCATSAVWRGEDTFSFRLSLRLFSLFENVSKQEPVAKVQAQLCL